MLKFIKQNWFKLILAFCAVAVAIGYLWSVNYNKEKKYQECINACEREKICIEEKKIIGNYKPLFADTCEQYSSTVACKNICVEKYK